LFKEVLSGNLDIEIVTTNNEFEKRKNAILLCMFELILTGYYGKYNLLNSCNVMSYESD